jgi:hypothetical protein
MLIKWSILHTPKDFGGLGIQNVDIQNKCLLSKLLFKLINEEGTLQNLLRRKYLSNKTLTQLSRQLRDSHFWSRLMQVKDQFLMCVSFNIHSGYEIRFRYMG